jgi:hypothetical protein
VYNVQYSNKKDEGSDKSIEVGETCGVRVADDNNSSSKEGITTILIHKVDLYMLKNATR